MNWRTGLGLVLLAAATISGWSAWRQRDTPAPAAAAQQRSDYTLENFELVALDREGKESLTLRAPHLQRNTTDHTLDIESPLFLLPDAEGRHWQVRALRGRIDAGFDELRLQGEVVGTSPEQAATPTRFSTESLSMVPARDRVSSPDPVAITRPGSILTGRGFEADLKTRHYRILSQVKARYEPTSIR